MNEEIINDVINKIKSLKRGEEFTISNLVEENLNNNELFEITFKILDRLKEENIKITSKYEGTTAIIGLPQNIQYIKE